MEKRAPTVLEEIIPDQKISNLERVISKTGKNSVYNASRNDLDVSGRAGYDNSMLNISRFESSKLHP